jgi:gamma-glutamyltranspeptidase/glutathione hydrolase
MRRHGGLITREDLAAYRAIEREPLVGTYRGHTVYTPPPASGGAALLLMLNILERFEVGKMAAGSADSLHLLAETMRLGHRDRVRHLGDTGFATVPVNGMTSKAYAARRAKLISLRRASADGDVTAGDPFAFESPSTTHYSVADREGNLVSVTYTLGSDFGSGVAIEGGGFLLNNQMDNFSHERAFRAAQRGEPEPPNAMQPGKRMMSTMIPTLVFRGDKPWLAVGTPGGGRIINTVLQVLVNVIDFKLNIDEATHQPRISQGEGALEVEPNFNPDTLALLRRKGHKIRQSETMGSAQSIAIEGDFFLGAADPRRPGAAAVAP